MSLVTITPAYSHPSSNSEGISVAYTSSQPPVVAMSRTQANMDKLGIDYTKVDVSDEVKNYTMSYSTEDYIKDFKEAKDYLSLKHIREKARSEENLLRQVYAKKSVVADLPVLKEKYPLLVPVYGNEDIFNYKPLFNEDKKIPKVFDLEKNRKKAGVMSIVDRQGFERNWRIFSERLLDLINWDNVFIAGGSVLACLLPPPPKAIKNFKCLRKYFHEDAYAGSDIDLFIYGLNEEQGKEKLKEIYEAVCNEIPYPVLAFRSAYAISIVSEFPYRHIQIILRLYSSPAEILMGFDVDSCSCGFDGKQVYMTPRCHQALVRQMNTVDMSRRSPTYEMRLAKYADRGFEVEVPTLKRESIDPMIFERPWDDVRGLAKLLLLEKLRTPEARYAYRERSTQQHSVESYKMRSMMSDPYLKKRLEYSNEKASDYSTVFLPWGPNWKAKKIRRLMMTKDIVLNSDWSETYNNRGYHTHPCFIGTLEEVLKDCCGECPEIPAHVNHEELECFVSGPLSFIVDDPGRQSIGSFHPITDGDWSDGAYLNTDGEKLVISANCGDVDTIKELVKDGALVDAPDCLGRTALHLAVLSNQLKATEVLLELGADPTLHLKDGRSILHIAAEYGYLDMLSLLLTKLKLLKDKNNENGQVCAEMDLDEPNKITQFSALHYAILFGHVDCVEFLLENGATCDRMIWSADKSVGVAPIVIAAHCECFNKQVAIDMYELLHRYGASLKLMDKQFNNVMHQLCQYNYSNLISYLLEHDAMALSLCSDSNQNGQSPLYIAITNKFYTLAKALINHGVPLYLSEEAIARVNNLIRMDSKSNRYGYCNVTLQNTSHLITMAQSSINTDAGVDFFKFLIEKGDDMNKIVNNQTAMDAILCCLPYLSEEEYQQHLNLNNATLHQMIKLYEKELKKVAEGSYCHMVFSEQIRDSNRQIKTNETNTKYQFVTWRDNKEYLLKLYKYLDEHGGKMFLELYNTDKEGVEKQLNIGKRNTTRRYNGFAHFASFNSSSVNMDDCVTVVRGKILLGEKRLEALRKRDLKRDKDQRDQMNINNGNHATQGYDQFVIYTEPTSYGWRNDIRTSGEVSESYIKLFEAVWSNDLATVRELCTPDDKGKCLFLTCAGYENMSPLSIAVNKGYKEMAELIFELVNVQYTPIPVQKELNQSGKVSNYALVTGDYEERETFVDPNGDMSVIINSCEPSTLFTVPALFDMSQNPPYKATKSSSMRQAYSFTPEEEDDNNKNMYCSLLEYLIYRGDCSFFAFVLEHLRVLSEEVFAKQVKANIFKEEDRDNLIITHIMAGELKAYNSYNMNNTINLSIPCIINDNMQMLRLINQYTFMGLNILREEDVKPSDKKVVKRNLRTNYDEIDYYCSDEELSEEYSEAMETELLEEIVQEEMEVEQDEEVDEEGHVDEEDSVESEYVDSDEEEMRAMRAFKQDGKMDRQVRLKNNLHPVLTALRYNATSCLRYLLDAQRVQEDVSSFASKYSHKAKAIEEAGGVAAVSERVFSLKYELRDLRLYLDAAASTDDVEIFHALTKEIVKEEQDMQKLVRRSKKFSSLFEFCCQNHHFNIAVYLIKNFSFREKELLAAYTCMANALTQMHIQILPGEKKRFRTRNPMDTTSDQIKLYKNIMELIMLIPAEQKDKILGEVMRIVIRSNRTTLSNEIIHNTSDNNGPVGDFTDMLGDVENLNPSTFKLLLECMGLKEKLMKENPHGYTVVEMVMKKYLKDVSSGMAVRPSVSDTKVEEDQRMERLEEEEAAVDEEGKDKVRLYRTMKTDPMDTAGLLSIALEASNGRKRELVTTEEVQKRLKKETQEANQNTTLGRRVHRVHQQQYQEAIPTNPRLNLFNMLRKPESYNSA